MREGTCRNRLPAAANIPHEVNVCAAAVFIKPKCHIHWITGDDVIGLNATSAALVIPVIYHGVTVELKYGSVIRGGEEVDRSRDGCSELTCKLNRNVLG